MGVGLLIGLVFLTLMLIASISLLIYFLNKKSKVGVTILSVVILLLLYPFFVNYFDQWSITKKDIKKDLNYFNIKLHNDFEIIRNDVTGMPERNQETELSISKLDARKIIEQIKNSRNFKDLKTENEINNEISSLSLDVDDIALNFKYPMFYSRELYKTVNNIPTRFFLEVNDGENKLKYQKLEQ